MRKSFPGAGSGSRLSEMQNPASLDTTSTAPYAFAALA
jgi:hypothetical protein